MRDNPVYDALRKVTGRLNQLGIAHAVVGGMALAAHGYVRGTNDVDILVNADGLRATHDALDGLGYVPPFKGSKQLKDVENDVRIEFLVTGNFPGDGKAKPVAFPEPSLVAEEIDGVRYIALPTLVELKLASGMTGSGRRKDLADVQELIRAINLPRQYTQQLNPYVRETFETLWDELQSPPPPFET